MRKRPVVNPGVSGLVVIGLSVAAAAALAMAAGSGGDAATRTGGDAAGAREAPTHDDVGGGGDGNAGGDSEAVVTAPPAAADAIDEPYDYPEQTDLQKADPVGAIGRLQVPEDTLAAMTSEALAWTVLDFPYLFHYTASSDRDGGVAFLAEQCNALAALLRRADAAQAVGAVRDDFAVGVTETDGSGLIKLDLLDLILVKLQG